MPVGTIFPKYDLGRIWNTVIGGVGGAVGAKFFKPLWLGVDPVLGSLKSADNAAASVSFMTT
jgi:hypothetical protein